MTINHLTTLKDFFKILDYGNSIRLEKIRIEEYLDEIPWINLSKAPGPTWWRVV
jgi:hypothetical protein